MKYKLKDRLSYRYGNFMAKGGGAIFWSLLILFLIAFGLSIFFRWLFLVINPESAFVHFWQHIWLTFLQIIDPGAIMEDTDATFLMKISAIITTFLGIVIFSMLIAFITTKFEDVIYNFRKGRSRVIESGHTLILGWNERVIDIIDELILANESERSACIVILADMDKEEMDDVIHKALPDTKTTRIVTREGVTSSLNELERVNIKEAKSVIILADCAETDSDNEKKMSDNRVIKSILAIIAAQDGENRLNIAAEIFYENNRKLLETFDSDLIVSINSGEILGKALVQTSLTSGLEMVFSEILSFDGGEVYFYQSDWKGKRFYELAYHFADGIPMGIAKADGRVFLRPDEDPVMESDDEILILAEDDSTIEFKDTKLYSPNNFPYTYKQNEKTPKRELILGWHRIGRVIINEYADYLAEGSVIDVMADDPDNRVDGEVSVFRKKHPNLNINFINSNPMSREHLEAINPFSYDNLIILSQDERNANPEKNDSDTLVILLLLRRIFADSGSKDKKTKIITQVLNSDNQDLIHQSNVDDFIISNKMISMIFAQLSEQPRILKLYRELFQEGGSEIYLKPAYYYFDELPIDATFADIMHAVHKRNEICLGIQSSEHIEDPKLNFGIQLNPKKSAVYRLDRLDNLVVLAEDDT